MNVNRVILLGRVGKDPEVRNFEGTPVANFSLATSESYKNKQGEKIETTEWHKIVAWRKTAEIVEKYVKKGSEIYVEGKIRNRTYESEGKKMYTTEIVADSIQLGPKPQAD